MSVATLVILTAVTLGMYYPVWFLLRRHAVNRLRSHSEIRLWVAVFAVVVYANVLMLSFLSGGMEYIDMELAFLFGYMSDIMEWVVAVVLLAQSFKIRHMLMEHHRSSLQVDAKFSIVLTFLFTIFYLQHKMNRLYESSPGKPGAEKPA